MYKYEISNAHALFKQSYCQKDEISCKSRPLDNEFAGKSTRTWNLVPILVFILTSKGL